MAFVDNIKSDDYIVEKNTRLFQICSGDLSPLTFELVNDLSDTSRGQGGFGSTNNLENSVANEVVEVEPEPEISL